MTYVFLYTETDRLSVVNNVTITILKMVTDVLILESLSKGIIALELKVFANHIVQMLKFHLLKNAMMVI